MRKWVPVLALLLAWFAPVAAAKISHPDHHHARHHHRRHHRRHHRHAGQMTTVTVAGQVTAVTAPGQVTGSTNGASASAPGPGGTWQTAHNSHTLIALGDVPGCIAGAADPVPYLQEYDAQILRLVISPDAGANGESLPCALDAVSAGYKLSVVLNYDNAWSQTDILDYCEKVLGIYGQYAWAVSIGNEQELDQDGWQTGADYAATWQEVEPVLAGEYPQAIRVAGEISPWGLQFLETALAIGLPGVQAVAAHPYARPHGFAPADLAELARTYGLQVWYSEGLAAPNSWGASIPLDAMPDASMAGIWLS